MRLYENEAKRLFAAEGIAIPKPLGVVTRAEELAGRKDLAGPVMLKSLVLIGGRGKAGGIRKASGASEAASLAGEMLGREIRGYDVERLLVEEVVGEAGGACYAGVTMNPADFNVTVIVSPAGGIDIEQVARAAPDKVLRVAASGERQSPARRRRGTPGFKLTDLRRLVSDDTERTIAELKRLRNTRYHDRPVSLYGGMLELPLIVTCDEDAAWFSGAEPLTDGRLWAERDARLRGETARLERELRDDLLGRAVWDALAPATRGFLASGEAVFRVHRDDPGFDFSGPAIEYAKAVETELNALVLRALRRALHGRPPAERETRVDGRPLDLGGAADKL